MNKHLKNFLIQVLVGQVIALLAYFLFNLKLFIPLFIGASVSAWTVYRRENKK
ncbi:hypothetical protein SAMN04488096_10931 [Mesonia phycicola]|uniref:Uncharacterized protein n=1 Tax=Mesonia phycicola TaxID=579105 RepID=A0A1M6GZ57_9FLAO|nr:hypothetical protein SAMN04488096_10931 [Mesonia phycicola]